MIVARRPRDLQHYRSRPRKRVDWSAMLADLRFLGLTITDIADRTGIPRKTVGGWQDGSVPNGDDALALVRLWCTCTGKSIEFLPVGLAGFRRYT